MVLTHDQAAEIRRLAIQANEREAREGLMPRRCADPQVLARVVAIMRSTDSGEGDAAA